MNKIIAIRREDKNEWERRAPIVPDHVRELKEKFDIKTIVQPSHIRVFSDEEYKKAGAEISENMCPSSVIFAIKEIPVNLFEKDKTYVFFSHTIKGQQHNMPMLKRMMELKCNLVDYERVFDEKNRRLIFFGQYAGLAGMIETFHAYGLKLKLQGCPTPFEKIKHAFEYGTLEEAKKRIEEIGHEIRENGLPREICPLVVGFTGYGNVSRGAQEIFDLLPHKVIPAAELGEMYEKLSADRNHLFKVVFKEEDMARRKTGEFELMDYYHHPENYESRFPSFIPYLGILVNCIYWTPIYPRLVTKEYVKNQLEKGPDIKLKVIGDISCDIDGAIEFTHKVTKPDNPTFTYYADGDRFEDGTQRGGITVMAVDNLPCEFPRESSMEFSAVLKRFVTDLLEADYNRNFGDLALPLPLRNALILHRGQLTRDYLYMKEFLK